MYVSETYRRNKVRREYLCVTLGYFFATDKAIRRHHCHTDAYKYG